MRELFRKLTKKLAGESPDDQASFLIYQAQKLKSKAYVLQESLNTIPTPPDFETLDKKRRQSYNHIYSLIDKVLAKAAGSSSMKSQLKVLEARWKYVHKQPLLPYTMDFNALDSAIEALSWQVKENCPGMKSQETKLSKKLLEKLVGNCEEKQLTFLMNLAKGINGKTNILEALRTLPIARSYDLLTKNERRAYAYLHCLVDKVLPIVAGSTSKEVQRQILKDRWRLVHKENFEESSSLNWKTIMQAIVALPNPKKFCKLSEKKKKHGMHPIRLSCLGTLIRKIAMTDSIEDHIEITTRSLVLLHKEKQNADTLLAARNLQLYFQLIKPLPVFSKPLPRYQDHYLAVKQLVLKIAGSDDQKILSAFLKRQFPKIFPKMT